MCVLPVIETCAIHYDAKRRWNFAEYVQKFLIETTLVPASSFWLCVLSPALDPGSAFVRETIANKEINGTATRVEIFVDVS